MILFYDETTPKTFPIDEGLRKALNESMCVADNISELTDNVIEIFWEAIPKTTKKQYKDFKNIFYSQIKINVNVTEENTVSIHTTFLFFNSKQELNEFLKIKKINNPTYNEVKNSIYIIVPVIGGWFDVEHVGGSLQHEMLHAYNHLKSKNSDIQKPLEYNNKKGRVKHLEKYHNLYKIASNHLNDVDIVSKSVAIAVYMLTGGEITAYVNGLYKRLFSSFVKNVSNDYDGVLYGDALYKFYIILKNFCNQLNIGKTFNFEIVCKTYNFTEEHAKKWCNIALQKIERGISYAVQKAKLDYENEIFRNENNHN